MSRSTFLQKTENLFNATISMSPKGEIFVSPNPDLSFPIIRGSHPFDILEELKFFYVSDRFYCYGLSKDKSENFYTSSYKQTSDEITLFASSGGNSKQIAKGTVIDFRQKYGLSTGCFVSVISEIDGENYVIDLKFQASTRSGWIDYINQCKRDRVYPDFSLKQIADKNFGFIYSFVREEIEPSKDIEKMFELLEGNQFE